MANGCGAFGERKREAVRHTLEDPVGPALPAACSRRHADVLLYLDRAIHPGA